MCGNLTFNAAKIPFDDLYFIPYSKGFAIKTDSIGIQVHNKYKVFHLFIRDLLEKPMGEETVSSELTEMIHIMGENMKISRFAARKAENGALASYIHMGGKIGVLVEFAFEKAETAQAESFKTFAHDVALQVAAVAPICATRDQVPAETVEHEKQIYMAQAAESGKPEAIQEKMAVGRLEKFYKQSVLTEQEFIKDSSLTIKKYAEQVSKELGDTITVVAFDRLVRGE